MGLVSVTAVGAFDAVGSILVVALMIAPPAAAYLLTDRLPRLLLLAAAIGAASALAGYWLAYALDASIAGAMATMTGVAFGLALLLAPDRGLLAAARRRARQKLEFAQTMLAIHLANHEGRRRPRRRAASTTSTGISAGRPNSRNGSSGWPSGAASFGPRPAGSL